MSARISIDLDETPDATVEVTQGTGLAVWVKLRGKAQPTGEQERYEVWLTPAQALSLRHGIGDVLMAMNVATIEAAGLEVDIPVTDDLCATCGETRSSHSRLSPFAPTFPDGNTFPGNTFPAMNK